MNIITPRFSPPRLDLENLAGNPVRIALPAFSAGIPAPKWCYAKLRPTLAAAGTFSISPQTNSMTGCTGSIDSNIVPASPPAGIAYFFLGVEVRDTALPTPSEFVQARYHPTMGGDLQLAQMHRDPVAKTPVWSECVTPNGNSEVFSDTEEIIFETAAVADDNLLFHVLIGFGS